MTPARSERFKPSDWANISERELRDQIADEIIKARNDATSPHHDFPHNECRLCAGMTFAAYIARGK